MATRRLGIAGLLLVALLSGACAGEEPPGTPEPPAPNTTNVAPDAKDPRDRAPVGDNPGGGQGSTPGPSMAPGSTARVEGMVVSLLCHKQNPNATPAQAKACAQEQLEKGGSLGVVTDNGTIYVAEQGLQTGTRLLSSYIGDRVLVDGVEVGEATDLGLENVKTMTIRGVRRAPKPSAQPAAGK